MLSVKCVIQSVSLTNVLQYYLVSVTILVSHAELYDDLLRRPLGALIVFIGVYCLDGYALAHNICGFRHQRYTS